MWTDRQTVVPCGQTDRQTVVPCGQTDRQTVVPCGQIDRQLFLVDRQTDSCSLWTDGQTVVPCGQTDRQLFLVDRQTDRHDEASGCFSQFSERAQKFNFYDIMITWRLHYQNKFGTMLGGTISVYYENRLKHKNTLKGQNVEILRLFVAQHTETTGL